MATYRQSKQVAAGYPSVNALDAAAAVLQVSEFVIPSGLVINDVIEMGAIPEGMIVTNFKLVAEDSDSNGTPLITLDAGLLSGVYGTVDNARTCGNEFLAASTVAQAGGAVDATKAAGLMLTPGLDLVGYGLKVNAAAATLTVGARLRTYVTLKNAPVGI